MRRKEENFEYPENLGCKFHDPKGKGCARTGCWAQVLISAQAEDFEEPKRSEMIQDLITKARAKGCRCV